MVSVDAARTTVISPAAGRPAPRADTGSVRYGLPLLADLLADAPARLWQQLLAALDIQALYNKNLHQATIHATITDSTPGTIAAIINDADDKPAAARPGQDADFSDLARAPIPIS